MMSMIATVHERSRQRLAEAGLARQAQSDDVSAGDMTNQQVVVLLWEYNGNVLYIIELYIM